MPARKRGNVSFVLKIGKVRSRDKSRETSKDQFGRCGMAPEGHLAEVWDGNERVLVGYSSMGHRGQM